MRMDGFYLLIIRGEYNINPIESPYFLTEKKIIFFINAPTSFSDIGI